MRGARVVAWMPLLAWAAACSDSTGPGGGTNTNAPISAQVGGQAWASGAFGSATRLGGDYIVTAARVAGGSSSAITLTLYNIRGPGTYPLGMGPSTVGGLATYTDNNAGWATPLSGNAGSVTLATLAPNRIAGTFEFTAAPVSGGAAGSRDVKQGRFDLPLSGVNNNPLPDYAGHSVSATLAGAPWTASTVAVNFTSPTAFIASGSNTDYTVSFSIPGINGTGSYPLGIVNGSAPRTITVQRLANHPQGAACCWGGGPGITGTFTLSAVTAARASGTFTASLPPSGSATGTITISSGSFDVGRH